MLADGVMRGPAHLRQHAQVRPDGDVVELRQHVQRGRRVAVPVVPADAAVADPAQQPALRRRPARDPRPTASTPRSLARPAAWDIAFVRRFMSVFGPISSIFDFLTFFVMLVSPERQPHRVPQRLVRRVARHPDAGRLRHPHPPRPVLPQPPEPADDRHCRSPAPSIGAVLPFTPLADTARLHQRCRSRSSSSWSG